MEVHLSGNHTCKGRDGKPHKFEDICDQLAGKYPKDFKFTGWHPHCRCYATSILKTDEEIAEDTRKMLRGEPTDGESVNKVEDVPKGFKDWLKDNEERIEKAKTLTYFLKDNKQLVEQYKPDAFEEKSGEGTTTSHKGHSSHLDHKPTKHGEQFLPVPMKPAKLDDEKLVENRNQLARLTNFSEEEIAKMRPMNYEEADSGNVNAQVGKKVDNRNNCQGCVIAFEARCRGIDVTATGYDDDEFRLLLEKNQTLAWRNAKGEHPNLTAEFSNEAEAIEFLNGSEMAKNGRYQLAVNKWLDDKDGHILNLIRVNNVNYIYDGQLKYRCELNDILEGADWNEKVELLRVDKLFFDERCHKLLTRL